MLARQPEERSESDDSTEVPINRLKVVGERPVLPDREFLHGRLAFISDAISRFREETRLHPGRYRQLADRLILLGVAVVLLVSAYILIADPG
jgi:hypothetical protein